MNPEWFATEFEGAQGDDRFKKLEIEAEKVADSLSLPLFIPHMAGRVMPGRPKLRGFFAGLQWDHGKPHLFRAILESVALEYGLYKEAAEKLNSSLNIREVRITGGGEKSKNWNTIKSGVLQAPLVRIHQNQGAPLGGGMIAAVASGMYKSFPEVAGEWISPGEVVQCDSSRYEFFRKRLKAYKKLLDLCEEFTGEFPFSD
jgi:xylulokinase